MYRYIGPSAYGRCEDCGNVTYRINIDNGYGVMAICKPCYQSNLSAWYVSDGAGERA